MHNSNLTALSARVITTKSELAGWRTSWQTLLNRSAANTIFLTPDWILTWIEQVNPDAELFVVAVEDDKELVGLAPFYIGSLTVFKLLQRSCLRVVGDDCSSSEYLDIIVLPEFEQAVIDKLADVLAQYKNRWQLIWVPYSSPSRGSSARVRRLFERLNLWSAERNFEYFVLELPTDEDRYWTSLSPKQRNNIRRYTKKLAKRGPLQLVNLVDEFGIDKAFAEVVALHRRSWGARGDPGAFDRNPAFKRFSAAFARIASRYGWVAIYGLMQNNEVIAVRFGYVYNSQLFEIQSGYRPDLNGSGTVCTYHAIRKATDEGLEVYDFLAGAGHYKQQFRAGARSGKKLFAGQKTWMNSLMFLLGLWPTGKYIRFGRPGGPANA